MKKKTLESQQFDFKASYFPSFLFSFSHKMPKVPSTCVEYSAKYSHWNKELTFYRTIWNDNRRKIAIYGEEEKDDATAKGRIARCYNRCKQPQNTINKCDACFIKENSILGFENDVAWKLEIRGRHTSYSCGEFGITK